MAGPLFTIDIDPRQIHKLGNAMAAVGPKMEDVRRLALKRTVTVARNEMVRVLKPQTGLKIKVLKKALVVQKVTADSAEIYSQGGDVRLHFFRPRETRKGVVAYPWNKKTVYPGVFMKGGKFPKRKGGIGAPVVRAGKARLPLKAAPRSGVIIPNEMISGSSLAVFYRTVDERLLGRITHELYRAMGAL